MLPHPLRVALLQQCIRPIRPQRIPFIQFQRRWSHNSPPSPLPTKNVPTKPRNPADVTDVSKKEQRRSDWTIMKSLVRHVWPKGDWKTKGTVVLGFSFLLGGKLLNLQVPILFKEVVDALNLDASSPGTAPVIVGSLVLGYGLARIGATTFSELLNATFANIGQRAIRRVARSTFSSLLNMPLSFHLSRQTGGLTRAIDRGTKGITFLLQALLFRLFPTFLEIGLVSGLLTYKFGWDFAAITLGTLAIYTVFTIKTTAWRTPFRRRANKADNEGASKAVDALINFEAVKHFNNEAHEVSVYDRSLADYERHSVKIQTSLSFLNSGQSVIFSSCLTATMYLAAQGVIAGTMTVGDLVMINQLIFQLAIPLNFLGTIYREMRQNLIDMEVLFRLREENTPQIDAPGAVPLHLKGGGEIRFENVHFGYNSSRPIFRGVSFVVPAGKKVAIVGPSGCGKSTVLKLLFRFYEPSGGRILVDGQDIAKVTLDSLRRTIGVVPQDVPLFHADIMYNIRYGDLSQSDDAVKEAARLAGVHDAIERLERGYHTEVGERGLMLSGGEKQRVALARVFLKLKDLDAAIMFFDEATSALDAGTEAEVMRNVGETIGRGKGITSVFVAHRLKTVMDADVIIVLKDGLVAEQGRHEDLLRRGGLYARMWEQQQRHAGIEDETITA